MDSHIGQRIVVTGASSGIGRALAILLAKRGARVGLVGRDQSALAVTLDQLAGEGHVTVAQDLTEENSGTTVLKEIVASMGRLDGLVHCAGIHAITPLRSLDMRRADEMFSANVTSALGMAKGFRDKRIRNPKSSLVFLSSVSGLTGEAGLSAYAASKGAIISLTKSLALELAAEGIRVNCLCPGIVETPMTERLANLIGNDAYEAIKARHPLGLGSPEDVAKAASFLLSHESRWMTGTAMVLDGGYSLG
ncbi:SDR family NAD(P)-dependent oxidoreductase [Glutamicibacter bergerei]